MSMSINDFRVAIRVENADAKQKFLETGKSISQVKAEMDKLDKAGKKDTEEYKNLEKTLVSQSKAYKDLRKEAGLAALSYNDLKKNARTLKSMLDKTTPGSKEWIQYRNELQITRARMKELDVQAGTTKASLSKFSTGFRAFSGYIVAGVAAITGAVMGLRKIMDDRNNLEDSQASLKALTGLDDNSVKWLTKQAKELSTTATKEGLRVRESAEGILKSFMLVGSAKPELLGDKEALRDVSEEAMKLQAAAKDITIDKSVDALTLSLNQYNAPAEQAGRFTNVLAAGSKIGAANIESQAAAIRTAGTSASSANVSIEETVGLIETLAYKGIKNEIAGTGLKKFFLTLQTGADDTNPKVVGLTKALENLKKKNMGAADIKKLFGEEGYNAASVIINNTQLVNDFTKAVTGTNIATEQAAINSNTASAKLAQAKNQMQLAGIELAEKLNPAITGTINLFTGILKYIPGLINWFDKYKMTIVTATAAVVAYTIAVNANTIAHKANVLWTNNVVKYTKILFATLKAHPYVAIAGAVITLVSLYKDLSRESRNITQSQKNLNEITKESTKCIRADKSEVEQFLSVARDEKRSKEERLAAIKRLNEISPEYLGNLNLETINTQAATNAVNAYVKSLLVKQNIEHANDKKNQIKDEIEEIYKNKGLNKGFWGDVWDGFVNGSAKAINTVSNLLTGMDDKWAKQTMHNLAYESVNKVKNLEQQVKDLDKFIEEQTSSLIKIQAQQETDNKVNGGNGGGGLSEDEQNAAYKKRLELLQYAKDKELNIIKEAYLNGQLTEEQYQEKLYDIDIKYLSLRKEAADSFGKDSSEIEGQLLDKMIARSNSVYQKLQDNQKKIEELPKPKIDDDQEDIDSPVSSYAVEKFKKTLDGQEALLRANRANRLISEEEFQDKLADIERQKLEQRAAKQQAVMETIANVAGGFSQLMSAMQDSEISKVEKKYDKQIDDAKKAGKDTTKLEEEKEAAVNAIKKKYADKQFAASVLQITASTAVSAMEAYKAMAGIPIVGPALGAAAAAAAVMAGAAQVVVAKQTRDEAKGLKSGGYSDDYVQGYTSTGNSDEVAGVIPVHKNEFVTNHEGVANPHVKQFLDVFNVAQKNGTIGMLNTTQILERIRTKNGFYSGGYSSSSSQSGAINNYGVTDYGAALGKIIQLLEKGNDHLEKIYDKPISIDVKAVRDGIKKIDKLEANVSR